MRDPFASSRHQPSPLGREANRWHGGERATRLVLAVVLLAASACGGRVRGTSPASSCNDNGAVHANGATWKCSDGCNACWCTNGEIGSTLIGCSPGGPEAGVDDVASLGPSGDASPDGGSCSISASDYNQSCASDSDCVGVTDGDFCGTGRCINCITAAIGVSAMSQYEGDFERIANSSPAALCPCANAPSAYCNRGTCAVCLSGRCGGVCVNERVDANNCGGCGTVCAVGAICENGACSCPGGEAACGGTCVSEDSDSNNCGGCGTACALGASCENGACLCPGGEAACGGTCVDEQNDPNNCGTCGQNCSTGLNCQGGTCEPCPSLMPLCDGFCVNEQTDPNNCGGCGATCSQQDICQSGSCVPCPEGQFACANACVNEPCLITLATGSLKAQNMAVDAASVYWVAWDGGNSNAYSLMKVPIEGGHPVTLTTGKTVGIWGSPGIALDSTKVYWLTDLSVGRGAVFDGTVMSVPLGGGTPSTLVTGQDQPVGIAVDATSVYWTTLYTDMVMKALLGGGPPITVASNQSRAYGVAVDATNVYWTTYLGGTVMQMPLGGGAPVLLWSGNDFPMVIAVDAANVYWTMNGATDPVAGAVMQVPIGGGTAITLASGQAPPLAMAVDSTSVYWLSADRILKVPIGGGSATTLVSGQSPSAIAVDATSLYWANGDSVMKLTPK
jgi:hypothetical protein